MATRFHYPSETLDAYMENWTIQNGKDICFGSQAHPLTDGG